MRHPSDVSRIHNSAESPEHQLHKSLQASQPEDQATSAACAEAAAVVEVLEDASKIHPTSIYPLYTLLADARMRMEAKRGRRSTA